MRFPNLNVGDKVLRHHEKMILDGGWGTGLTVRTVIEETVARVTAKQAVTETGLRFTLEDGTIHGFGSGGTRVCMYPIGYVNEHARNAIEARPMQATSAERMAELDSTASNVKTFVAALNRFERNERKILKHVLQTHGMSKGGDMLVELANGIKALMEGFKP